MEKSSKTYRTIKAFVNKIKIVDTHEHLVQEGERLTKGADLFETFLMINACTDLVSSGMSLEDLEKIRNPKLPLEERWKLFEPYWESIQNTGYARSLNIAARLYGLDGINKNTYKTLAARMQEANKPGLYDWILKKKAGIAISILDSLWTPMEEVDRRFFAPVFRIDDLVMIRERRDLEILGKKVGKPIHSFSDFIQALELEINRVSKLIVGIKIGLAYLRSLRFNKVSQEEAEEIFVNIYNQEFYRKRENAPYFVPDWLSFKETKPLQDFILHKIIQAASARSIPIQVHTGIHEGNENILTNSNPTLLTNIFAEYKEAKFDVLHGSYPYVWELAALAKTFPNVYIDMCWLHIISPHMARLALTEWLDTVPHNKILGFGGDYTFPEGTYGHSVIARENIARVLTEKVEDGSLTLEQAINIASKLLGKNACRLFSLKV